MQRTIVQSADVSGAALDEFKHWLGISRDNEDAFLTGLLGAALDMCEAFTGQMPLEVALVERHMPSGGWMQLRSTPIREITQVEAIDGSGSASAMPSSEFAINIDARGKGSVKVGSATTARAFAVTCRAGIAQDWAALPDGLRHGIIRLAAHHYRDRDMEQPLKPPASIAALWRPWRVMRLA